ncbi:MAG: hypothetical protein M3N50_07740 [Pseudomonadota bacterium]|nr:hypothetical protein [Pseudomonadota bacterium]
MTQRRREFRGKIELFDPFWEAPEDISKGYGSFHHLYKDNYAQYLPSDKNANILGVSCDPDYGVLLLNSLRFRNVLGIDSFAGKTEYARKGQLG